MLAYLDETDVRPLIEVIYSNFTEGESVPDYESEVQGIDKLVSLFEAVKSRRFPRFHDKAAKLVIEINKGHFFSNGNKRLALVCLLIFAYINDYEVSIKKNSKYYLFLNKQIQKYGNNQTYKGYSTEEKMYYLVSLVIADSNDYFVSHDKLKSFVKGFLRKTMTKKK